MASTVRLPPIRGVWRRAGSLVGKDEVIMRSHSSRPNTLGREREVDGILLLDTRISLGIQTRTYFGAAPH